MVQMESTYSYAKLWKTTLHCAHTVHHRPAAAAGVTHPCRSTEGGQIVAGSVAVSASGAGNKRVGLPDP